MQFDVLAVLLRRLLLSCLVCDQLGRQQIRKFLRLNQVLSTQLLYGPPNSFQLAVFACEIGLDPFTEHYFFTGVLFAETAELNLECPFDFLGEVSLDLGHFFFLGSE